MPEKLEEKSDCPIIVLSDDVRFYFAGRKGLFFERYKNNALIGHFALHPCDVYGIYSPDNQAHYQDPGFKVPISLKLPKNIIGTQIVFSHNIIYAGELPAGKQSFRYLGQRRYEGELAFENREIKAIFDKEGELIWLNKMRDVHK